MAGKLGRDDDSPVGLGGEAMKGCMFVFRVAKEVEVRISLTGRLTAS